MKKIISISLLAVIIPQITFAAWWNPLSWFNNWTFSKPAKDAQVQILEYRIKELENRLEDKSAEPETTTETTTATTSTTTQILLPAKNANNNPVSVPMQPPKKSVVVPQQTSLQAVQPIVLVPPPPVQPARDYKALYDDLLNKYIWMRDRRLTSDIVTVEESNNPVNDPHLGNLKSFSRKIDEELIPEIYGSKQNPNSYDTLLAKYNNLTNDYKKENDRYAKVLVYDYINRNKYQLYNPAMHIQTAYWLDLYDRTFGTKYAVEFRSLTTQVETVEFANSLLLDILPGTQ